METVEIGIALGYEGWGDGGMEEGQAVAVRDVRAPHRQPHHSNE